MEITVIGNIIGFIGSAFMIIMGAIKSKEKTLLFQTIQVMILALSNVVLGSISGCIIDLLSAIRNILSSKGKLNKVAIALIIVTSTILTVMFNKIGIIGYFPLIANTIFILFMNAKGDKNFKILLIVYFSIWLIHNIYIKAYTTSVFNVMTIISSFITIYRIDKGEEKRKA